jgi:hypothetical protein
VLHHLPDPDAGLAALREALKPEGSMHLMVYAQYGRKGIYMLQEYCRRLGVEAVGRQIADLVAVLKELPLGHPLGFLLREAADFQNDAELADAILNPQDRAYTVPQVFDFVKRAGLVFGRWMRQAPYDPHCGIIANTPHAERLFLLPLLEQYAAVELFRGTMTRHSMVVYRSDNPGRLPEITFAGEGWLQYIPIRLPDTLCVQERLPPGLAAALINRNHTYHDLVMMIDKQEKQLLNSIDGIRNSEEVIKNASDGSDHKPLIDKACTFFERLWRYDQAVFDISRSRDGLAV